MIGMTVCSGIGAPEQAAPFIDWRFASEIEAFPSAVLCARHPETTNLGDMTRFQEWPDANVDVLVGGTPCQSFSVAGLRKGLADPRGNLALTFLALADRYRPAWIVWENVPGVLSSNGGRDFGAFLGGLGKLGYGWAYRVLDAQFFGVPQRRRRVFVVGCARGWAGAAAVLFEPESLRGDPPPCRQAGKGIAQTLSARPSVGGGLGTDFDCDGGLIMSHDPACTLTARERKGALPEADLSTVVAHSLRGEGFDASEDCSPLLSCTRTPAVAFSCKDYGADAGEIAPTLRAMGHGESHANGGGQMAVALPWAVRRLTPRECERLQGFPDEYTAIEWRGKPADQCPDGPRYKALGNSMAVPVMRWILSRVRDVEALQ